MTQRKRVRDDEFTVIPLSLIAGGCAVLAGAAPTGDPLVDPILTGIVVAGVVWTAAIAHWWVIVLAAGLTIATVLDPILIAIAVVPLVLGMWIGTRLRNHSLLRCVAVGLVLNVLVRSELDVMLGASAIVGVGVAVILLISGASRRSRRQRRIIVMSVAAALGLVVLSGGSLAASAFSVRSDLRAAIDDARVGIDQLSDGDLDEAAQVLESAADSLDRVHERIDAPWTQSARVVPVLAQHRHAAVELTDRAADLANVIRSELDVLELESLRPVHGRIDLDAVDTARISVDRLLMSVEELATSVARSRSVWLAAPITRELDDLSDEVDRQLVSARRAHAAAQVMPAILGRDEPRRYFLAFTSPAEARGGGGFMGSWADVEITDGQIVLRRSGRTSELNTASQTHRVVERPADFIARYGPYGFTTGAGGSTASDIWSVINLSPHFPSTAEVITQLYPQSGGAELDGVISIDVFALARFLEFTGPIRVSGLDAALDANNAAQFLLYDQYQLPGDNANRVDVLASVTRQVVTRLLAGGLPGPRALVDSLAPMVEEGRLAAYAVRPDEQSVFAELGMSGGLESEGTEDVLAISFNNATASKLELFLDATLEYSLTVGPNGAARSTARLTMANSAPTSGWSSGVIGNYVGLPTGTNRLWVTATSRLPVLSAIRDGIEIDTVSKPEAGLIANDWFVDISPGSTVTLEITFEGWMTFGESDFDPNRIPLILRLPPLVRPMQTTIRFAGADRAERVATFDRAGTFRRPMVSENFPAE